MPRTLSLRRVGAAAGLISLTTLALVSGGPAAGAAPGAGTVRAAASSGSYAFQTAGDSADPTFNQLLGINDQGEVAGYYGSGTDASHPNRGYTVVAPYAQPNFTNENFPGSAQTQVIGIDNAGDTVGFYVDGTGANHGFTDIGGTFATVDNPASTASPKFNQLLGINNKGTAIGFYNDAQGNSHGYIYNISTKAFTPVGPTGPAGPGKPEGMSPGRASDTALGFFDTNPGQLSSTRPCAYKRGLPPTKVAITTNASVL